MDRLHDVYTIQIQYFPTEEDDDEEYDTKTQENENETQINPDVIIEIKAHPDDSISDLKRQLQDHFWHEWSLTGRKQDRDGIATGWELITKKDSTILGSWFFLRSYDIQHLDFIYAVVRRHHE